MSQIEHAKILCKKLLSAYGIAEEADAIEIEDLKIYKSQLFGFCHAYSFQYKNRHFLVSDDYSLMDNPKYIKAVFADAALLREGKLFENPVPQSDGARYALGLDGLEYYLWENSPIKARTYHD